VDVERLPRVPCLRAWPYREYSEIFFDGSYKVLRGASWASRASVARTTFRNWDYAQRRQLFAGFRCVTDVPRAPRVPIDVFDVRDTLARDVRTGLTGELKQLPPKYFYDARGSELFDRITTLPEYYPTRCEREILNPAPPEIHGVVGDFDRDLGVPTGRRRLFAFLGATIGNLFPDERGAFLSRLRDTS
jgi:hypothetical protein